MWDNEYSATFSSSSSAIMTLWEILCSGVCVHCNVRKYSTRTQTDPPFHYIHYFLLSRIYAFILYVLHSFAQKISFCASSLFTLYLHSPNKTTMTLTSSLLSALLTPLLHHHRHDYHYYHHFMWEWEIKVELIGLMEVVPDHKILHLQR